MYRNLVRRRRWRHESLNHARHHYQPQNEEEEEKNTRKITDKFVKCILKNCDERDSKT